jgi:type 2A phosphatase activator TIP41
LIAGAEFDWTYSTPYAGTVVSGHTAHASTEPVDVERLKRRDPILFFDEVILFEDELADNGGSMLSVKLRVMPSCFFALQRLFIRVDDVMFRVFETRLYHEFGKAFVVRETQRRESTYAALGTSLPRERSKLNDANHMTPLIALQSSVLEAFDLAALPDEPKEAAAAVPAPAPAVAPAAEPAN